MRPKKLAAAIVLITVCSGGAWIALERRRKAEETERETARMLAELERAREEVRVLQERQDALRKRLETAPDEVERARIRAELDRERDRPWRLPRNPPAPAPTGCNCVPEDPLCDCRR
jgi:hypothetical protein